MRLDKSSGQFAGRRWRDRMMIVDGFIRMRESLQEVVFVVLTLEET